MTMTETKTTKLCKGCHRELPLSDFTTRLGKPHHQCRTCKNEYERKHRAANPDLYRTYQRRTRLKNDYGITEEEYQAMYDAQDGLCALCRRPPSGRWERLCVDHDHNNGRNRGLLCTGCNYSLGVLGDSPAAIARVYAYCLGEPILN